MWTLLILDPPRSFQRNRLLSDGATSESVDAMHPYCIPEEQKYRVCLQKRF